MGKKCMGCFTHLLASIIGGITFWVSMFLLFYVEYWPLKFLAVAATILCAYFICKLLEKVFRL